MVFYVAGECSWIFHIGVGYFYGFVTEADAYAGFRLWEQWVTSRIDTSEWVNELGHLALRWGFVFDMKTSGTWKHPIEEWPSEVRSWFALT